MAKIFLINVGANASHRVKSPIFADSTFELLPIPEHVPNPGPPMTSYRELSAHCRQGESLLPFIPPAYQQLYCHYDPEFITCTYGDDPTRAARAAALKGACEGDLLLFLARLCAWDGGKFAGASGFYLVAMLEVASILRDVRHEPSESELRVYGANAHIRRAQADPAFWNGFWVFKGTPRSRRFEKAIPLTPELARLVLRDRQGEPWRWRSGRTPLQTIGSYTRTIRCIGDTASDGFQSWPQTLRDALIL